jgi:hypothetical protein
LQAWPDLLHSKEFGQQQRDLSGFQCNLWRTCWLEGKALDVLNRSYKFTVAIEFVHVPKAAMPVVKEPKKKDDKTEMKEREAGRVSDTSCQSFL